MGMLLVQCIYDDPSIVVKDIYRYRYVSRTELHPWSHPVVVIKKTCIAYKVLRLQRPARRGLALHCTLTHCVYLLNNRIPPPLCPMLKERSPKAQRCTVFALIHSENTIILPPLGCEIAVQPLLNTLQS